MAPEGQSVSVAGDIRVLLVDDSPEWLRFVERTLTRERESFDVTTAGSASEAIAVLRDDSRIDCVVSDYQMPGTDGLELLDRVREESGNLPFVLVTAAGNEDVASEAIASGVDDYLIKNGGRNSAAMFAARITKAVENSRLQKRVAASEQRYRTLVEQSSDAILIVQNDRIVFANSGARQLSGLGEQLRGTLVTALFRDIDAPPLGESASFEATVDGDDGERIVSVSTDPVEYGGAPAALWSVRDITEQKRRERELRQERDIKEALRSVLVNASTREDLVAGICTELVATDRYAFAWVGEPVDGELRPTTWASGPGEYLESFDRSIAGGDEPSLWATRDRSPQFVADVTTLFASPWRTAALERDYRAIAALPLIYDDLFYGVLTVYAAETGVFDDAQQKLLEEVAEALAYAIDSVEQSSALATGRRRQVTLSIHDRDHPFVEATAGREDVTVAVTGTVAQSNGRDSVFATVSGMSPEAVVADLDSRHDVDSSTVVDGSSGRIHAVTTERTVGGTVAAAGGIVVDQRFENGAGEVTFTLGVGRDVRRIVDELSAAFEITVLAVSEADERTLTPQERLQRGMGDLTEKQAEVLRTAHHAGYFEQPREQSADEVAAGLGISRSTFLQHLRSAQRKLFTVVFGDR